MYENTAFGLALPMVCAVLDLLLLLLLPGACTMDQFVFLLNDPINAGCAGYVFMRSPLLAKYPPIVSASTNAMPRP